MRGANNQPKFTKILFKTILNWFGKFVKILSQFYTKSVEREKIKALNKIIKQSLINNNLYCSCSLFLKNNILRNTSKMFVWCTVEKVLYHLGRALGSEEVSGGRVSAVGWQGRGRHD